MKKTLEECKDESVEENDEKFYHICAIRPWPDSSPWCEETKRSRKINKKKWGCHNVRKKINRNVQSEGGIFRKLVVHYRVRLRVRAPPLGTTLSSGKLRWRQNAADSTCFAGVNRVPSAKMTT